MRLALSATVILLMACPTMPRIDAGVDAGIAAADAGMSDAGACRARSCEEVGASCGEIPGDCGGKLDCGQCEAGGRCSGDVCLRYASCGDSGCCPLSCESTGSNCGSRGDGCGGVLQCGSCDGGLVCGGGDFFGRCGRPPTAPAQSCEAHPCWVIGATCGAIDSGCGDTLRCGECDPAWGICGALAPNVCAWRGFIDGGVTDCASFGPEVCGSISNGDGGLIDCGSCDGGRVCGAIVRNLCAP